MNDAELPTSEFVYNPNASFPGDSMRRLIEEEVGKDKVRFLDATELANHLLGDAVATNFFMLGYAYQSGLIPVSAEAIEQAIDLNNVAVEFNQQAFLWGRRAAVDLDAVRRVAGVEATHWQALDDVDDIIDFRVKHLTDYQDAAYAQRYRELVERVRTREIAIVGDSAATDGDQTELVLTRAVAKALHKLMAYKDEYEVARLYSNGDFLRDLAEHFEGDYKLRFHLAPPILARKDPDTGLPRKRTFSGWALPVFGVLAKLKFLRGSRLDPFAYSKERQMERAMIDGFLEELEVILAKLDRHNRHAAVEAVQAVETIRGFGHVKLSAIAQYQQEREQRLSRLDGEPVQFVEVDSAA